ncbi:MlaD family protein [Nocardia huaxiensis]|uniref:MCE family protein n=1 Tax=Nocardia huaxiensis TaxID=2755382 RepID=A0A7D6VH26_9NOCA|nr:MlaD family protein [Nocardia huaxiensis]QLY29510.1 MCE family protein [Nocardia huaxiensis]UFS96932.1 MlaD family protein [Nocardia huaxiensis]
MTRKIMASGLAMVLMALAATAYLTYGVFDFKPGQGTYKLSVLLPNSGGLMQTSPVTLNGLQVGKVRLLEKSEGGILAGLEVDDSYRIPLDAEVTVANLSAVGEQYINFAPKSAVGPYFGDGAVVPAAQVVQPLSIARALGGIQGVMAQINPDAINQILAGADIAIQDVGPSIEKLVNSGSMFATTLRQNRELIQRLVQFLGGAAGESTGEKLVLLRSSAERLGRTLLPELPVLLDQLISITEESGGTQVIPFIPLGQRLMRYLTQLFGSLGPAAEVIRPYLLDPLENSYVDLGKTMDGLLAAFPDGKGFRLLVDIPH